ncbi:hypothetical protein R1sor_010457 [Riccia sorocarpa]|uniref:Endonuclease/exonuclease/phosphatase domain-containing protein n=1 Tax=Riccia sorocarpa TaxID=122646 RepID=A0ABD3HZK3_9MARC
MDTPPLETVSEEERIRLDLERLFGPEDFELETGSSEEFDTDAVVDFPPITSLQPEELYSHLEQLGILQLPFTTVESIRAGVQDSVEDDPRFWGTWRNRRVKLVPDRDDSGRIKYKTVVADIDESSGEVWVSRLWTGDEVHPLIPFGALLEGKDGVYRAGIDVDGTGVARVDTSPLGRILQSLQATNDLVQNVASDLVQVKHSIEELKSRMLVLERRFDNVGSEVSALKGDVSSLLLNTGVQCDTLKEQQLTLVNLGERLQSDSRSLGRQFSKLETGLPIVQQDLIVLAETWETSDISSVDFPGFTLVTSVWNKKRTNRGRGFGGLTAWVRMGIGLDVNVHHIDKRNQFFVLRIQLKKRSPPMFFVFCYFAPFGAPVYKELHEDISPMADLSLVVRDLLELGPVNIVGDFNARIANSQNQCPGDRALWRNNEDTVWKRDSVDIERNRMGEPFLQFLHICDLTILNGVSKFPNTTDFTFSSHQGASVVDFLIASHTMRDLVCNFKLGPFLPESDHRPLLFSVLGFSRDVYHSKDRAIGFKLDAALRTKYEDEVGLRLGASSEPSLPLVLMDSARHVFPPARSKDRTWFDVSCRTAREAALHCAPEDRSAAYRKYRHFIRARKRLWLRKFQDTLAEDLMRQPETFWRRFTYASF